jgi:hypothetical protein
MVDETMAEDPGPGEMGRPAPGPGRGETAPGLRGRETPETGDRRTLPIGGGRGRKIVFVDFGRNKVYALADDGDEVMVFNNLVEIADMLSPAVIVVDSLPGKFQGTATELAKTGVIFLRLKDLSKLSEERKKNGLPKSNENDVILLKTLYRRESESFQTLCMMPDELLVRELSELWAAFTIMRKTSKQKRALTPHPAVLEAYKELRKLIDELSEEIHRKALGLPLYRQAFEGLGLKGPALAYILSHDGWAFKTLNSDKLQVRYQLVPLRRRRSKRSRLLIMLANTAVLNNHPRYRPIFEKYMERFRGQKHAYWKAVLRVARRILRDLKLLANGQELWTPTG